MSVDEFTRWCAFLGMKTGASGSGTGGGGKIGKFRAKLNKRANPENLSPNDFFVGLGYWTRANVEQCLLATRGSPKRLAKDVRRLIVSPRQEHSRKPDEIYDRIERLAEGPYLELFARNTRPGWNSWGNEVGIFDDGAVKTRRRSSKWKQGELRLP